MSLRLEQHDLGRVAYADALARQQELLARVIADPGQAHLLLLEHVPPVITLGRSGRREHVLASAERLRRLGVELHPVTRGGGATWHGPGQLVAYPIVSLTRLGRDLHGYVRRLERAALRTLRHFGVAGRQCPGRSGVWVGQEKIASVGVAVRRWTAWHGLALNVGGDLSGFELIVPCGLAGARATSLSRLLGREVSVDEVKPVLAAALAENFGFRISDFGLNGNVGTDCGLRIADCEVAPKRATECSRARTGPDEQQRQRQQQRQRPDWLKVKLPAQGHGHEVEDALAELELETVCRQARCPNQPECFARGTATFLILGPRCTRRCGFCAVPKGMGPQTQAAAFEGPSPAPPRPDEPAAVAEAAARLGLRHVVITSVTRDDLPDGGAAHFAAAIRAVRAALPQAAVEVLTPDFQGRLADLETVLAARPDVFNHNIETVPRLYPAVRPRADYRRSLDLLSYARRTSNWGRTGWAKSGLMVGLGETDDEVVAALVDLRGAGCDIVTIGQYLAPAGGLPVARYVRPAQFEAWAAYARQMGFAAAASGPLVRSSYQAERLVQTATRSRS